MNHFALNRHRPRRQSTRPEPLELPVLQICLPRAGAYVDIRDRAAVCIEQVGPPDLELDRAVSESSGRNLEASTDATLRAEILSYSRSRGLFAGVSLEGTSLRPDDDATEQVYGRRMTARAIVTGNRVEVPESGRHLVNVLEKSAPYNESKKTASR